jgi:hypothetical protein
MDERQTYHEGEYLQAVHKVTRSHHQGVFERPIIYTHIIKEQETGAERRGGW